MPENGDMDLGQRVNALEREMSGVLSHLSNTNESLRALVTKMDRLFDDRSRIALLESKLEEQGKHLGQVSDTTNDHARILEQGKGASTLIQIAVGAAGGAGVVWGWLRGVH